ncbi:hypothetical protein CC86DRAFT_209933 [Ophiobolus disseminans]|uniref:BTB domain-containing protein n=1 Tax=Ophiobolus disseminans TaxID=1469910 RepID=A0A6A7A3M9_9PLEO|nr:hypothetical protein CC86DRAFT_209933 [Ophiobolus disseminans]
MASQVAARVTKDKAFSFDVSTQLTVVVGKEPNHKRFLVHEGLLCARFEFFKRAMNGNWAEREERLIKLPEDDPETFATYINVVYTNRVATNPSSEPKDAVMVGGELIHLCKVYVLGEKLCDIRTKNAAV